MNLKMNYFFFIAQTNLQFNNNKFYLLQLLEDDSTKVYSVWFRWGRGELCVDCCLHTCPYVQDKSKESWFGRSYT